MTQANHIADRRSNSGADSDRPGIRGGSAAGQGRSRAGASKRGKRVPSWATASTSARPVSDMGIASATGRTIAIDRRKIVLVKAIRFEKSSKRWTFRVDIQGDHSAEHLGFLYNVAAIPCASGA